MVDALRRRSGGAPAARSMLLTVLGEYMLRRSDGVWLETHVRALQELGYSPQAARQAVTRGAQAGLLERERRGRRVLTRLTAEGTTLLEEGARRIYGFGSNGEWDGQWLLVVVRVPEQRRELRHRIRTTLTWNGFGSLGQGLWISARTDREASVREALQGLEPVAQTTLLHARLGTLERPESIVADAWDIPALENQYREFLERFTRVSPSAPAQVFRAQTAMIHEWRKFPFIDPGLPRALLPSGWVGHEARNRFLELYARWEATSQRYFEELDALSRGSAGETGRVAAASA